MDKDSNLKFQQSENRIFALNDSRELMAEVTYPFLNEEKTKVNINHTFVHPSLRGQNIAQKLMLMAYEDIKKQGFKAVLTCSYAVSWYNNTENYKDILEK